MREYNDGTGEPKDLQNRFTAYLVIAVGRRKAQYRRSKAQQYYRQIEIAIEIHDDHEVFQTEPDMLAGLPLFDQLENTRLRQSLANAKERELYIFLAKALEGRSFPEIAAKLGVGHNTVASIYYRMIARLIKELGGEDV